MNICEGLFSDGEEAESKAVYEEYFRLLRKDEKLHTLPSFLENAPKATQSFDECVNSYFSFYYDEFESLIFGYKGENDSTYQTSFKAWESGDDSIWWCPITIHLPADSTKTFEVVMLSGGGNGGVITRILMDKK